MNIQASRATTAALAEGTKGISPEERVAMEWMTQEQRRKLLEAKGFDPAAIAANLARVGVEAVEGVAKLPAALKGVADIQQAAINEWAVGKKNKWGLPPTAVAVGKGVVEAVRGTAKQLWERPGEWLQENPDVPLGVLAGGVSAVARGAGVVRAGKAVDKALLRREYAEKIRPGGDVEGISEQPYVHRAVEMSLFPGPSGAARPETPNMLAFNPVEELKKLKKWEHYRRLPLEEQARLDRAVEQGFTIDAFRGSGAGIEEFDPAWLSSHTDAPSSQLGFFFSKDAKTANSYVGESKRGSAAAVETETEIIAAHGPVNEDLIQAFTSVLINAQPVSGRALSSRDQLGHLLPSLAAAKIEGKPILEELFDLDKAMGTNFASRVPKELAERFDKETRTFQERFHAVEDARWQFGGPNIMGAKLRMDNPYVYDYAGARYREESYYKVIARAKKAGHDSVILKNTYDGGGQTDVYVVFSPEQIRSKFAMFHPEKSREKGLIASVAFPLGLTTAAAAYLANKEEQ